MDKMHIVLHLEDCDPEVHSIVRESLVSVVATFWPETSYTIGYASKKGIVVVLRRVKSIHPDLVMMLVQRVLHYPRNVASSYRPG